METKETIEITDLALTEDQQVAVKGGPTMQDCLVSGYQSGGHESGVTVNQGIFSDHNSGALRNVGGGNI